MTAVSDFIAYELKEQWGLDVDRVINNGVDVNVDESQPIAKWKGWAPIPKKHRTDFDGFRPLIIHGVNDRSNANKGWDHIEALSRSFGSDHVLSLDESVETLTAGNSQFPTTHSAKLCMLGAADLVVHPSGYEGNSMFVAEALACGVPVVGYDVGYLWSVRDELQTVMHRELRSPEYTLHCVKEVLQALSIVPHQGLSGRHLAVRDLSLEAFCMNWRSYLEEVERDA
jgi:glycosyltransferase involved in cell wall biosynthesis